MFKLCQGLGQCGFMPDRHPPHNKVHFAQNLEPFGASVHEFGVKRVVHKCLQLGRRFPDCEVRNIPWVTVDSGCGISFALVAFHHPNISRHPFAKSVDPVKIVHEISDARVSSRGNKAANVEFSEMSLWGVSTHQGATAVQMT